jgi:adenosylcobyric acid synthase
MACADVVVLPGSKQTADDLRWMRERGFEQALDEHARRGGLIVGICGGLQMLGNEILDPDGMEHAGIETGLGLLPVKTVMERDKVTVPARGVLRTQSLFGQPIGPCQVSGYEIHLGTTEYVDGAAAFASISRQGDAAQARLDGCVSADERIFGTYLHGLFDEDEFRHAFLRAAHTALRMPAPVELMAWSARRREQLDLLADGFGGALDLDAIFKMVGLPRQAETTPKESHV